MIVSPKTGEWDTVPTLLSSSVEPWTLSRISCPRKCMFKTSCCFLAGAQSIPPHLLLRSAASLRGGSSKLSVTRVFCCALRGMSSAASGKMSSLSSCPMCSLCYASSCELQHSAEQLIQAQKSREQGAAPRHSALPRSVKKVMNRIKSVTGCYFRWWVAELPGVTNTDTFSILDEIKNLKN